jgi:hypothetical protein
MDSEQARKAHWNDWERNPEAAAPHIGDDMGARTSPLRATIVKPELEISQQFDTHFPGGDPQ